GRRVDPRREQLVPRHHAGPRARHPAGLARPRRHRSGPGGRLRAGALRARRPWCGRPAVPDGAMTRAAGLEGPRRLVLAERETGAPGPGQARVRIAATAVCHTDLEIYRGRHPNVRYPVIMGHEASGVVDAVGPGVTAVTPGQRVVIDPIIACGTCD